MERQANRLLGVTLIAILLAVNGVLTLLAATGVLGPSTGGIAGTVVGVLFGLALLYLAYGMWMLRTWAWLATLVLEGLNVLFALAALALVPVAVGEWITLIVAGAIIYYLTRPEVRAQFGRRSAAP